jgi:hypothetical protein
MALLAKIFLVVVALLLQPVAQQSLPVTRLSLSLDVLPLCLASIRGGFNDLC